ncbi:HPr family phosphocarrier protein [bacterium]|nr:HPr family phosphocarrier protein [bacterium]
MTDTVKVINKLGVHARPAAMLVQRASKFSSKIEIEYDGTKINAKSIMGVMMLAAACGSELKIIADGDDALESIEGIKALIASKFDEE